MKDEAKKSLDNSLSEIIDDEYIQSIEKIEYTENCKNIYVYVNREKYENSFFDSFSSFAIGIIGIYYQSIMGVQPEQLHVELNYIDIDTNELIVNVIYPDAFE